MTNAENSVFGLHLIFVAVQSQLQSISKLWSGTPLFVVFALKRSKIQFFVFLLEPRPFLHSLSSKIINMPLPLTPQQQQLIKSMLLFEIPYAHTAEAAKCTERQVHRIKANLLQYNTVCAPKALIQGQKWKIT